jgi:hypothetical protein
MDAKHTPRAGTNSTSQNIVLHTGRTMSQTSMRVPNKVEQSVLLGKVTRNIKGQAQLDMWGPLDKSLTSAVWCDT